MGLVSAFLGSRASFWTGMRGVRLYLYEFWRTKPFAPLVLYFVWHRIKSYQNHRELTEDTVLRPNGQRRVFLLRKHHS